MEPMFFPANGQTCFIGVGHFSGGHGGLNRRRDRFHLFGRCLDKVLQTPW